MNKYLKTREAQPPTSRTSTPSHQAQAIAKPRSWKTVLIALAVAFAIYSFFGQFLLPYQYRWSTISGGVIGGTESASVETSLPAKENAARVTARAAAEGEIGPRVTQAGEIAKVDIDKQKELNKLQLELAAQQAKIQADQAAMSAEATLYAQCQDRANAAATEAAAKVASRDSPMGTTQAEIDAMREMVSMNAQRQCDQARAEREEIRQQARAVTEAKSE